MKVRSGENLARYRRSYNYRSEYFKRNPGLFGHIWFCSQCGRPLIGKDNVYIDHIIPLSKGGRNHVSNCTAICFKCNRAKSDKIDGRIVKGEVFKIFESTLFRSQRGVGAVLGLITGLGVSMASGIIRTSGVVLKKGFRVGSTILGKTLEVATLPLRKGSGVSRLLFLIIYVAGILFLLSQYTDIFNHLFV